MALLSGFGLGHVRKYAPSTLTLSALLLILRAKSQIIENSPNVAGATVGEFRFYKKSDTVPKKCVSPNNAIFVKL